MKVGIIVYSKTGNTKSVAEKIKASLLHGGHDVTLEDVTTVGDPDKGPDQSQLKNIPETAGYEAVIFGAPVWAFSLCSVMKHYFGTVNTLQGKKVGIFVTQSFRKPWLGGNKSIKWMKKACQAKNGDVLKTGIINWKNEKRETQIEELVKDFAGI